MKKKSKLGSITALEKNKDTDVKNLTSKYFRGSYDFACSNCSIPSRNYFNESGRSKFEWVKIFLL